MGQTMVRPWVVLVRAALVVRLAVHLTYGT